MNIPWKDWSIRTVDIMGIGWGFALAFIFLQGFIYFWFGQSGAFVFITVSATIFGGIVGFIFAIPNVNQEKNENSVNLNSRKNYTINSNLNQVSDWLTKIIIGATLINFKEITKSLYKYSLDVDTQLGSIYIKQSVVALVIIGFSAFGFLAGYMITRIIWSPAFVRADSELDLLRQEIIDLKEENEKLKKAAPGG
jgi:hypothetical protein